MRKIRILLTLLVLVSVVSAQNRNVRGSLFNGKDLSGWNQSNGQGMFNVVKGKIVASTASERENPYISTDNQYRDFILEFEAFVEEGANAVVRLRAKSESASGELYGYNCEIGSLCNGWNGGVYSDDGRGWLYTGELNPVSKSAFKPGQWNNYRIECVGNQLRTWINDKPVAYVIDNNFQAGVIALQVDGNGEQGKKVHWRNIRINTSNLKPTETADIYVVNLIPNTLSKSEKEQGWSCFLMEKHRKVG
jgi:hypothetical protein